MGTLYLQLKSQLPLSGLARLQRRDGLVRAKEHRSYVASQAWSPGLGRLPDPANSAIRILSRFPTREMKLCHCPATRRFKIKNPKT